MAATPPSLLERLREHPDDSIAWQRFDNLYRPLLSSWLGRYSIQSHDADDLVQDILQVVLQELPHFHYEPAKGRFRNWLRTILVNRLREFWREERDRPQTLYEEIISQLEDPASDLSRLWAQEHDEHVAKRLLTLIEPDFAPVSVQAFRRVMDGEQPRDVAASLKISLNAVFLAKSRILKRLREEIEGLAD